MDLQAEVECLRKELELERQHHAAVRDAFFAFQTEGTKRRKLLEAQLAALVDKMCWLNPGFPVPISKDMFLSNCARFFECLQGKGFNEEAALKQYSEEANGAMERTSAEGSHGRSGRG